MDEELWNRFQKRDRRALSRLISHVASGINCGEILARLPIPEKQARVIALTGSGGVGKSTLVGRLLAVILEQKQSVAVLACDPQSPLSGGALLGDRFRMAKDAQHDNVFVRSLAALSGHSALADHLDVMIHLLEAYGFDNIIIETVGAGQGDTAVRELADVVVLLLQPETGDDLQWEKAGVLEVADVLALNKFDLPKADHALAEIKSAVQISSDPDVSIIPISAKNGDGIQELWEAIAKCDRKRSRTNQESHELLQIAQATLAERFQTVIAEPTERFREVVERWKEGKLPSEEVGDAVLRAVCDRQEN